MDEFLGKDMGISFQKVIHIPISILFRESFFYFFAQITFTKLSDDICVIFCCIHFMKNKNMRCTTHWFQDLDLGIEQNSINLAFEHFKIYDFDSYRLIRGVIPTLIDLARIAFPYRIIEPIGEILNFLSRKWLRWSKMFLWHFIIKN